MGWILVPPTRLQQINVVHPEMASKLEQIQVVEVLADFHQLLSSPSIRNKSPCSYLSVGLSRGEAGQHILGGRLWWRISTDIFSLVGVKPPTFFLGCNHGSHRQHWYYSIDLEDEEFIYVLSLLGSYNKKCWCRAKPCITVGMLATIGGNLQNTASCVCLWWISASVSAYKSQIKV